MQRDDDTEFTKPRPFRRREHAAAAVVAGVVLLVTALFVDANHVGGLEVDLFRFFNDLSDAFYWVVWAVMQLGNVVAVPVVAALALLARRFRLAAGLLMSGLTVWLLAKVVKVVVERGRPAELIEDVVLRHAPAAGHGYISGHAAVAAALATVAGPYLGRRLKVLAWVLAALVGVARVYVGAHLPLDAIGGAALGWGIGSLVNVVLGPPARRSGQ